jgi:hypothetical protein
MALLQSRFVTSKESAGKTVFSYEEATRLLPEVRRLTEEAFQAVEALGDGDSPARDDRASRLVSRWAAAMEERGLQVKGLWLVDFDNGSGYYCWCHPEPALLFYHTYEEGFRGRVRIQ